MDKAVPTKPTPDGRIAILFINLYVEMGGGEYSLLYLLKNLDRNRYRPIMMFNKRGPFVEKVETIGVETVILPYDTVSLKGLLIPRHALRNLNASKELYRYLKRSNVEIVHAMDVLSLLLLTWSSIRLKISVMYEVIFFYEWSRMLLFNLLALILVKRIVVHSQAVRKDLERRTALLSRKMALVYYGVDLSLFEPCSDCSSSPFRRELGVSSTTLLVGMVARYDTWKGHATFLSVARMLLKSRDDLLFLVIGGEITGHSIPSIARYEKMITDAINGMDFAGSLRVLGHRNDIPNIMASLDVLVCPSDHEPFGLVVLESLACGVPVVVSRTVGALEVIGDAGGVFIAEPRNADSFARGIELALNYRKKSNGVIMQLDQLKNLTWEIYAQRFGELYVH
jgi:glycosyltransferase involved in cell wall biosynthesis